ncbi:MAG: hypothetical protein K6E20_00445 [Acholeplasmatales bacterium]|nr:hypothetical protein [Acholeplasmatales bacterium]
MKCLICNEHFYVKRKLLTLFKEEKEYICNRCYKRYPIRLSIEKCQLDIYDCFIISIFEAKYNIDYNVFYLEYSKIFKSYYNREGFVTLFFNKIKFDDETLSVLDCISKLNCKNIIVVTFYIE